MFLTLLWFRENKVFRNTVKLGPAECPFLFFLEHSYQIYIVGKRKTQVKIESEAEAVMWHTGAATSDFNTCTFAWPAWLLAAQRYVKGSSEPVTLDLLAKPSCICRVRHAAMPRLCSDFCQGKSAVPSRRGSGVTVPMRLSACLPRHGTSGNSTFVDHSLPLNLETFFRLKGYRGVLLMVRLAITADSWDSVWKVCQPHRFHSFTSRLLTELCFPVCLEYRRLSGSWMI